MKVQLKHLVAAVTVFLAFSAGTSRADLVASWSFDAPAGTVGPTDTIALDATVTNDSSSTENITSVTLASIDEGTFSGVYGFGFGPLGDGDPFTQFSGLDLAPGASFGFVLGLFTPVGGSAPTGTYSIASADMVFNGADLSSANGFERTVASAAVPEPSTLLLLGSGLAGLAMLKRRWALD